MRDYFSLIDLAIAGAPVILFCLWQLVSVNRAIGGGKADSPERASPEGSGHTVGEHRLDDG